MSARTWTFCAGLPLFRNVEDFKKSVYWAFTAFEQSNWHPLSWLSHMLDVEIYQHWAGWHHITNIILHSLNTLLLFALFWRMTGKPWRCAAVAAMFAVHPMHVESVAWVAERKDVLSTFFGLLTLHAYVTYSRAARFSGGFLLCSACLAAIVGMLGWLWYYQCFWWLQQVISFQTHQIRAIPDGYEALVHTGQEFGGFAALFLLSLGAVCAYAASSGRTSLLRFCSILLAFAVVGLGVLARLWSLQSFGGPEAHQWTNWFCGAVAALGVAGGVAAAVQRRYAMAAQCGVFAASVAALMLVLHWIQWVPSSPPGPPAWYNNPFQTIVERTWCTEFAVAIFVVIGSAAVDAVTARRTNLWLFGLVFALYVVGLLAKPMLVTLPFVMLLLDFWPLGRMDAGEERAAERPAPPADAARMARRRTRQKRTKPAPAFVQPSSASTVPIFPLIGRIAMLCVEKAPLFALAAVSSVVTPIAQSHGGSMASSNDLPIEFRLQNSTQSYAAYIGRMFWPGKMMSLHLLLSDKNGRPYVEQSMFWLGVVVFVVLTSVAVVAFFLGRRYITFGWAWYVGILVPVIGFVQVGEQAMADRYTYVSYVGLFIAIVWGIGDLLDSFPRWPRLLVSCMAGSLAGVLLFIKLIFSIDWFINWIVSINRIVAGYDRLVLAIAIAAIVCVSCVAGAASAFVCWVILPILARLARLALRRSVIAAATACIFVSWISWTNYQCQTWHDREVHLRHALEVEPDNWNMLNNLGVHLWKSAQEEDRLAAKAEADRQDR